MTFMARFRQSMSAATARLAFTYLAIIMLMSLGFSLVLYRVSWGEIGRQIPPDSLYSTNQNTNSPDYGSGQTPQDNSGTTQQSQEPVGQFLEKRAREGRSELIARLVLLNITALALGSALSYILARKTLSPLERAMEAQAQFVSDASHELRTPLAAMQVSNEVALRSKRLSVAEAREVLHRNIDDVNRLKSLSDRLLNLARQTKPPLAPTSLKEVVTDSIRHIQPAASRKRITLANEVADALIETDNHSLCEVLVILLDNAVKYSPQKTTVTVSARRRGRYSYISVTDHGDGIASQHLGHIFQRFYRADASRTSMNSSHSGHGLGLAIAKQIMLNLDGDIGVHSRPGEGSVFTLKVPLAKA